MSNLNFSIKSFFIISICLLILPSCEKPCENPEALNTDKEGNCVFFEDIFDGTFKMTKWTYETTIGEGSIIDVSHFDLEYEFTDRNFTYTTGNDPAMKGAFTVNYDGEKGDIILNYENESLHSRSLRILLEPIIGDIPTSTEEAFLVVDPDYNISNGKISNQSFGLKASAINGLIIIDMEFERID